MELGSIPKGGIQERCMSRRLVDLTQGEADGFVISISLFRIVNFAVCCHPSIDLKAI